MRTFVINLERARERRAHMETLLGSAGITFERFDAINGDQARRHPAFDQIPAMAVRPWGAGELGCLLSHYEVWRTIAAGPDRFRVARTEAPASSRGRARRSALLRNSAARSTAGNRQRPATRESGLSTSSCHSKRWVRTIRPGPRRIPARSASRAPRDERRIDLARERRCRHSRSRIRAQQRSSSSSRRCVRRLDESVLARRRSSSPESVKAAVSGQHCHAA